MRLWVIVVISTLLVAPVSADHELGVYWFGDMLVYDQFTTGGHEVYVVQMRDGVPLAVADTLMIDNDFSFDGYGHWRDYLLVVIRNRIEVFDLAEPSQAVKVAVVRLQEGGTREGSISRRGGVYLDSSRIAVLTHCCNGSVRLAGDPGSWVVDALDGWSAEMGRAVDYSFPPRVDTTIRTTEEKVYELVWAPHATAGGGVWRELFLQQRRARNWAFSSALFLGANLRTYGE